MPLPTYDPNHVAEGLALFTSMFQNKQNIQNFSAVFLGQVQKFEDAVNFMLSAIQLANHPMSGGPWNILDLIGDIVGQPRDGMTDAQYVPALQIRIRVNKSNGLAEDIIQVGALIVSGGQYAEVYPASWEYDAYDISISVAQALLEFLGEASAAGSGGYVRYSLVPVSECIVFGSTIGTVSTANGFMDKVSSQFANGFVSLQEVN